MADENPTPEQLKAAQELEASVRRRLELERALRVAETKDSETVLKHLREQVEAAAEKSDLIREQNDLTEKQVFLANTNAENAERQAAAAAAEAQARSEQNAALQRQAELQKKAFDMSKKLVAEVRKVHDTYKDLGRQTGLVAQFEQATTDAWVGNARLGIAIEDNAKATGELHKSMPRLTSLRQDEIAALVEQAAVYESAGLGAANFAAISDTLITTLGRTVPETKAFSDEIVRLGTETGLGAGVLASKFAEMGKDLVQFGSKAEETFTALAKQSRALGVDMGKLLSIAEGFDTFEGAATTVGKLNAQLGLNLNAVALMNEQDPSKRIQMIRDQFLMTGKSFETMSRLEKKAVADMMGIDVSLASRMLGTEDDFAQATKGRETAAKLSEEFMTLSKKIKAAGQSFLVAAMPVIKVGLAMIEGILYGLGEVITFLSTGWGKAIGILIAGAGGILFLAMTWMKLKSAVTGASTLIKGVFSMVPKAVGETAPGLKKTSTSLGGTLKSLGAGLKEMAGKNVLFGALNLIPAGIGLLAATPGMLAFGLAGLMAPFVVAGLTGLATGLSALGQAKGALMGIGILALLGLALLPFAYAMSLMAGVSWETIGLMTVGILAITAMAAGLTFAAPFIAIGALALAGLGGALLVLAEGLLAVNSAASGLSDVQALIKASVKIDSGSIENLEKLVDQVVRVTTEANTKEDTVDKILQALGLGKADKEKTETTQKTIKLMLNERELGEVVTDLINERYDLATT
jgi:Mg2+ and Co2+ transporter CorA